MTTQTEAERLADELERWAGRIQRYTNGTGDSLCEASAAELRRLVSFNQQLMDEVARLNKAPDYAWPTIADYEKEVGFEVNIAFRSAWAMARTTNDIFKQMGSDT